MQTHRPVRMLVMAALAVSLALAGGGTAAAQDDGTTSTTQLDLSGGSTPAATPAPPTRVDAGAGGTASDPTVPLTGAALAGGLVIVVGAAALKLRREHRA